MPTIPDHVLQLFREDPQMLPLPLEPMHGWRSAPDDGDHAHCMSCAATIYRGDPCVGRYLEYISVVFCPACVFDNPEQFRVWLPGGPPRGPGDV